MRKSKDQIQTPGFTLIELLLVVLVLGLLIGSVAVSLDRFTPKTRLEAAAREIASTLELARDHAVQIGKSIEFHYDFAKQRYYLLTPPLSADDGAVSDSSAWEETEIIKLEEGVIIKKIVFSKTDEKSSGKVVIGMNPLGQIDGHVVHLQNESDDKMSVVANPVTGLINLEEGWVENNTVRDTLLGDD